MSGATKKRVGTRRIGNWLPNDPEVIRKWLDDLIKEVEKKYTEELKQKYSQGKVRASAVAAPVKLDEKFTIPDDWDVILDPLVREFKQFVDGDPTLHMQYTQMFTEVKHDQNPMDLPQVKSYEVMFALVNFIMLYWAPRYNTYGLVGFPINVILNWSMQTVNGYAAFLNVEANNYWNKVLNKWGEFLTSEASTYVLNTGPHGWLNEEAKEKLKLYEFQCDPNDPDGHYGFKSWDDFFVRIFKDGMRPVASPGDQSVVVSACESLPYSLRRNIQYKDKFWIKEQPYSLRHLLNNDDYTSQFEGGTLYQAFLSALSYHRWHSPIDGKIVKAYNVPGTYYSATLKVDEDYAAPDKSQGYICQVAARAVMFIQADNPAIGLMCFVAVGMSEVSTCQILPDLIPQPGGSPIPIKKGQEIGMFHFGGSTHCLIFRPGVPVHFTEEVQYVLDHPEEKHENIKVMSKLAVIATPK